MNDDSASPGPLAGLRVLELGQLIAGPFAAGYLAWFGAEVVKIEPPEGGDPLRKWRCVEGDNSWWWYSLARNKRSLTLDLRHPRGQQLVRDLIPRFDVLIENFRPGVMEHWGLGPADMQALNPDLVYTRVSGYGQTGPLRDRPGFASVCEGFSGIRYLNGEPGEVPVRPNLSIGDTIAGLHAVVGTLMALINRGQVGGEVVDVALYESMFTLLEGVVPEFSGAGVRREPSGTTVTGIVPTNTYPCRDGKYLIIGGNGDSIFRRLMTAIGRDDLAADPQLAHNPGRVEREPEIDAALRSWCAGRDLVDAQSLLEEACVPCGPVLDVEDILDNPQYRARGMIERCDLGDRELEMPAYAPRFERSPGRTRWAGPALGEHTRELLMGELNLSARDLDDLKDEGVI